MNDSALTNCHKCDGCVRRIISGGTGMIFKGSGFYLTDYARAKNPDQKQSKVASRDKKVEKLNG